jgi:hypothetical protein
MIEHSVLSGSKRGLGGGVTGGVAMGTADLSMWLNCEENFKKKLTCS